VDTSFFFDPNFWIAQAVLFFMAWLVRAVPDLLLWRVRRQTRRFAQGMTEEEAERFWAERDEDLSEAPRWLEFAISYSFLRRARRTWRATQYGQQPEPGTPAPPDAAAQAAVEKRKSRRRPGRPPFSSRLTSAFTALGGGVIGGKEGADYASAWTAELTEVKNPVVKVAHALSNIIGAFRIRIVIKTAPRFRRLIATPARIAGTALDVIASSEVLSYLLAGGPAITGLIVAGYMIGKVPLAFSTAIAAVPLVSGAVELWRRRRLRKRKAASAESKGS
jgi:hypothetical protein